MKKFLFASVLALGVSAAFASSDCCPKGSATACPTSCAEKCSAATCAPDCACDETNCDDCSTGGCQKADIVSNLYNELVKRSSRIDTEDEEQRGEIKDVLTEVKSIVDECNDKLSKSLEKYQGLREELNLQGSLTLNLSVDGGEESAQ